MNDKRGFTLIEVLAVIIVIAIASIVAAPRINNAIINARIEVYRNSTYGVARTAEHYIARRVLAEEPIFRNVDILGELNVIEDEIQSGEVIFTDDNKVIVALEYGNQCFLKREEIVINIDEYTNCETSLIAANEEWFQ